MLRFLLNLLWLVLAGAHELGMVALCDRMIAKMALLFLFFVSGCWGLQPQDPGLLLGAWP